MTAICRALLLAFFLIPILACSQEDSDKPNPAARWHFHFEELQIQTLQNSLSKKYKPDRVAFVNANLIAMRDDKIQPEQTVIVENGKIISIGPSKENSVPEGFVKIDCTGKYLMPGLVDMHVHNLVSSSQHLLNLANGVTSVRDMDGFPWMLKMRDQISTNKLLAPNMYVTGHILNQRPLGMYATVVTSADEARRVVRQQKTEGYDFIKIHNSMDLEIYSAILDESKKQNIDTVGHIPHFITVKQAVEHGQKTFEHFKGYILDRGLVLTKEDYIQASRNIGSWNCPTFYTYREHLRGDQARKLIHESGEMKYVSWRDKKDWLELAKENPDSLQQNILPLSIKIFKDLIPSYDKFLAGTDSGGGYPFMVPGFSLQEELRIMNTNGLASYQTLKTATVNAAQAMSREKEFGTIETGKRADLLLLRENPLKGISNLQAIDGVAVRGIWLSRKDLDEILSEIERIYNPAKEKQIIQNPTPEQVEAFLKSIDQLKAEGFIFRSHDVEEITDIRNTFQAASVNSQ